MSWLEGKSIQYCFNLQQNQRNKIAENLFKAWYIPFCKYGVIHGDPHFGNYSVRSDYSINLMDFGAIRIFSPNFVKGIIDLYFALQENNLNKTIYAYKLLGFKNINRKIIIILNQWAFFLYSPLLENKIQMIQKDLEFSISNGRVLAQKIHSELQKIGTITPPKEFFLMDRATVGLGSVLWRLKAMLNWYQIFNDLIQQFDFELLKKNQINALKYAKLKK